MQTVRLQAHLFRDRQSPQLLEMRSRARGEEQGGAEVLAVGQTDLQPAGLRRGRRPFGNRRFRHDRKIADELTAAPEIARHGHALELGAGAA